MDCDASSDRTPDTGCEISEELLRVMADPHRRAVVEYFVARPTTDATLSALVEYVHSTEASRDGQTTESQRREIAIGLHHNHLPKLEDQGVLSYELEERRVRYRTDNCVETVFELLSSNE